MWGCNQDRCRCESGKSKAGAGAARDAVAHNSPPTHGQPADTVVQGGGRTTAAAQQQKQQQRRCGTGYHAASQEGLGRHVTGEKYGCGCTSEHSTAQDGAKCKRIKGQQPTFGWLGRGGSVWGEGGKWWRVCVWWVGVQGVVFSEMAYQNISLGPGTVQCTRRSLLRYS